MIKLPASPQFQTYSRVAAYALLAALVTAVVFAADGAYRWYRDADTQVAAPLPGERSVEAPEPVPVEAQPASRLPSQALAGTPEQEVVGTKQPAEQPSAGDPIPSPAIDPAPSLAGGPAAIQPSGPIATETGGSSPGAGSRATANPADGPVPGRIGSSVEVEPQHAQPKALPQSKRPRVRRPPAKQATRQRAAPRDRVTPRRPAQAEQPNVYWERDSELGFAPQLRKRACNPATGQMPMQCYYPREGRERFPAKPLD